MAKSLTVDFRERVVAAVAGGMSRRASAERFGVGVSSAGRWVLRARERGDSRPDKRWGNLKSRRIDANRDVILAVVDAEPDLTLTEIGERLGEAGGFRRDPSVVHRFFVRRGIPRKKDRTRR